MASKNRIARMIAIASSVGTSKQGKGESSSSVCVAEENESLEGFRHGSVSISGKFENCGFYFGKDTKYSK